MYTNKIPNMYAWACTNWSRPSDPINIVFRNIDLEEIERFLTDKGWKKPHLFASDQYLSIPDPYNHRKQDLQLVKQLEFDFTRYHVRLWSIRPEDPRPRVWDGVHRIVLAGTHMDRIRGTGHVSADFESVEKVFADEFSYMWQIEYDDLDMQNGFAGYGQPYNNGQATVITR